MKAQTLLMVVAASLSMGCASIVDGTTQEISFNSNPEGATVLVDGATLGKTPMTFPLKKSKYHAVSFSKDGYKTLNLPLSSRLDGMFWGNIVLGGFIGSTTDGISGAANEYSPGQFMVSLEPTGASKMEVETSKGPQQKAREFIVMGYANIMTDLSHGQGEYLRSMMELLAIPATDQAEAVKKLRALSEVYSNILEFADHAMEIYLNSPKAAPKSVANDAPKIDGLDWTGVRYGTPEVQYQYLVGIDTPTASNCLTSLQAVQKTALNKFVLHEKGHRVGLGWGFDISPNLDEKERRFVYWYLKSQTDFKPRSPGE